MADDIRELIVTAVRAGRYEGPPDARLLQDILDGAEVRLDRLNFDSLGWMEFCISIELDSGQELTPAHIAGMTTITEVADWLRARAVA